VGDLNEKSALPLIEYGSDKVFFNQEMGEVFCCCFFVLCSTGV
jgi:hypothetical protein